MGIIDRINRVIKSNMNDLLDKMTDPAKEIELLVVEMEESLKKAKEEVISVTASAKQAATHRDEVRAKVDLWQHRAEQAVRASDDNLAREALRQRATVEEELRGAESALAELEANSTALKSSLHELELKLRDFKSRKETLKLQAKASKEGGPAVKGGKAFEDFQRMEDRVETIAAEAELTESLDGKGPALEAKFARLEKTSGDPKVEDALAELKRKMNPP
jgi:phage shock protein A